MRRPRQSAAEIALSVPGAWAVGALLPLAAADPFRATLVILPMVVAALRALERHAPRRAAGGGRGGRLEGAALVALVLFTLGRHSLGLAATDWFLAGGYLLLLAHRVARLVVLWRGALGEERPLGATEGGGMPRRPPAAFFLLPWVVYLALLPWQAQHRQPDGDEPFYLLIAHSLVHDLDADLANNYAAADWRAFMERPIEPQPGDPRGPDGEIYSRHNLLLPLVVAPAYALAGRWGVMVAMTLITATLAWTMLSLALRYASSGRAAAGSALSAYAVFAFSPPLLVYSYQIWIEVPAALAVAVGVDRLLALRRGASGRQLLALALVVTLLPLVKLRLGLVALPLAALALYRARPPRRAVLAFTAGTALVFSAFLLHNLLRYGHLLKIHRWSELNLYSSSLADFARGAFGMLYDAAFGLFPCAPIWLLLLPAGWLLVRRRDPLLALVSALALPYLVALAPRFEWYGGWSPPFRYPLVFLPLAALALVPLFERRHRPGLTFLAAGLGVTTLVLAAVWVVVPGWTYNFADGRTHLLDQSGLRLGADVARLFPSTVRPRLATWIWPLASLLAIPLAGWRGTLGRHRRGRLRLKRPAAAAWGFVAVLLFAAAVPLAARHWPTRVIELEDAWVFKDRGRPFPDTWVLQRPRYRGGWVLTPNGRIEARLAPGGETVRLRLAVRLATPGKVARLRVAAGDVPLGELAVPAGDWQEVELGPFEWPAGAPLVFRGGGAGAPGRLALDRVELMWEVSR